MYRVYITCRRSLFGRWAGCTRNTCSSSHIEGLVPPGTTPVRMFVVGCRDSAVHATPTSLPCAYKNCPQCEPLFTPPSQVSVACLRLLLTWRTNANSAALCALLFSLSLVFFTLRIKRKWAPRQIGLNAHAPKENDMLYASVNDRFDLFFRLDEQLGSSLH